MSENQHQTNHFTNNDMPSAELALAKQKFRYERVRKLCKNLNRERRHLRNKVDLLCNDLVGSNKQLVQTLGDLRFLCNFQHELMGENDRAYLLHKAIRFLVAELEDTSAAVFLSETRRIEAHLIGSWQRENEDLERIESILQDAVIAVCQKAKPVLLGGAASDKTPGTDATNGALPYTMMGLPIVDQGELLGAMIFYCDFRVGFNSQEQARLQSCLPSLGRQIAAVQRLHTFLCGAQS